MLGRPGWGLCRWSGACATLHPRHTRSGGDLSGCILQSVSAGGSAASSTGNLMDRRTQARVSPECLMRRPACISHRAAQAKPHLSHPFPPPRRSTSARQTRSSAQPAARTGCVCDAVHAHGRWSIEPRRGGSSRASSARQCTPQPPATHRPTRVSPTRICADLEGRRHALHALTRAESERHSNHQRSPSCRAPSCSCRGPPVNASGTTRPRSAHATDDNCFQNRRCKRCGQRSQACAMNISHHQ